MAELSPTNVTIALKRLSASEPRRLCRGQPSEQLELAIEQFNRRDYFECHETLEALWRAEPDELRYLYQGLLHLGVGYYHLLRGNHRGAVSKLSSGLTLLQYFLPDCLSIDLEPLVQTARRHHRELLEKGPERLGEFDLAAIPTVRMNRTAKSNSAP